MKDTRHLMEWKELRNRYNHLLNTDPVIPKEQYQFRIECIDRLIFDEETKQKEIAHFR